MKFLIVFLMLIAAYLLGQYPPAPTANFPTPIVMLWPPLPRGYECASQVGPCTYTGIEDGRCTGLGLCGWEMREGEKY